jgi:hypothetical protein
MTFVQRDQQLALARKINLVAASPALLEACEYALVLICTMHRIPPGPETTRRVVEILEAAIMAAHGEETT